MTVPDRDDRLSAGSVAAIAAVRRRAGIDRDVSVRRIHRVLSAEGLVAQVPALCRAATGSARVTLNFHPDRVLSDGRTVAVALRDEGAYRSQYETGISSGGLSAFPGGDRDEWERRLFDGAYHDENASPVARPKYGGFNLGGFLNGPAPAFGSCALVLRPHEVERTTFLFGDSSVTHEASGTADAFESVLAALLERVAATRQMVGLPGVSVRDCIERLLGGQGGRPAFCRILNDYIETQTHGPISLATDAEALLLDPSFRDTPAGAHLLEAADRFDLRVTWHPGSTLTLDAFPADAPAGHDLLRWQEFLAGGRAARLAARVISDYSSDGLHLTAAAIGAAGRAFQRDPGEWREWGAPDPSLTALKDLWRVLAVHGSPR